MATSKTAKSSFTGNVYREGYRLLQSFTNAGAVQAHQITSFNAATLAGMSGVMSLGGGDGVRLIFYATTGGTAVGTVRIGLVEPIMGSTGNIDGYIERTAMATGLVLAVPTGSTITAGAVLNAAISGVPSTAVAFFSITAGTGMEMGTGFTGGAIEGGNGSLLVYNPGAAGNIAWVDYRPAQGSSHVHVTLTCSIAGQTIYCLARRLQGDSQALC